MEAADRVVVGSLDSPAVVLREAYANGDGWCSFVVELHGTGLDAEQAVVTHRMSPLPDYFSDLAAHWRGWHGERKWESTEPGLRIVARHDGRHVWLVWTATQMPDGNWTASVETLLEPGEELSALVRDIAELLGDL